MNVSFLRDFLLLLLKELIINFYFTANQFVEPEVCGIISADFMKTLFFFLFLLGPANGILRVARQSFTNNEVSFPGLALDVGYHERFVGVPSPQRNVRRHAIDDSSAFRLFFPLNSQFLHHAKLIQDRDPVIQTAIFKRLSLEEEEIWLEFRHGIDRL